MLSAVALASGCLSQVRCAMAADALHADNRTFKIASALFAAEDNHSGEELPGVAGPEPEWRPIRAHGYRD
ncbi:hypothetical protein FHS61_001549 [Altererythrobacter atlanticus]|uniref:Uncharacterized protein n=1 Tax=Croceibacterium atlanticum TaxID=1267766 RepID=A0A0F7KX27_9SPHN|nr:hypothetical protein WYH_03210 [Croceibacterium atlanticum]MBB5732540.1 hypothetical protein [Croceibacterium atlanticum]